MKQPRVIIIGSGPAGLAAATYTSRAALATTIFAGQEPGGQLTKTTEIENYPGTLGKTGPVLMADMTEQATKFGAELVYETVEQIRVQNLEFRITTDTGSEHAADAIILTMGASPRLLGVGEERYWGKGFSTCAVCDAAFYKDKDVYVVGGGDAAIEDAVALTKFARHVTMLVRGDKFRASVAMQKRIPEHAGKITVRYHTQVKGIEGERVERLVLDVDGKPETVTADGLFFAIGHLPATGFLAGSGVALDEQGYIKTGLNYPSSSWLEGYPTMTNVPGIFAAGDCVDYRYRQAATASGMGVMAALDAEKWLEAT